MPVRICGAFAQSHPNFQHTRSMLGHPGVDPETVPLTFREEERGHPVQERETRWSLSRSGQNTKTTNTHGQHRPCGRYQRFIFKQDLATILQKGAPFDSDFPCCHGHETEKSESHSGKQSLMSVMPNQAAGIVSGSTSNNEKSSTFGQGRKRKLLLRASTMSLCFKPPSLRTAKKNDSFFWFKSESHHPSSSQQTNRFEVGAAAVSKHRSKLRLRSLEQHPSPLHRVGYRALGLPQIAPRRAGQHRGQTAGPRGIDWKRQLRYNEGGTPVTGETP